MLSFDIRGEKYLDNFEIDNLILVGHSFGGRVAIKYTFLFENNYNDFKLCLVDSAGIKPRRGLNYYYKVYKYKFYKKFFPSSKKLSKFGSSDYKKLSEIMKQTFLKVVNEDLSEVKDHTFVEGEIEKEFSCAKLRGDIEFSVVLYIAEAGTPEKDETHLANEEGYVLGEFDNFILRLDGTGSLFPVFEVYEKDQPLWYVRCDWTDPLSDSFAESVSINLNTAHKNFKYIDRTQKTFCAQLLVEVMSAALCCIIEKIRSEKYLEQILGNEELEQGSIGEVIRYFANTLGWDFSTPDNLSLTTRKFFDGRVSE